MFRSINSAFSSDSAVRSPINAATSFSSSSRSASSDRCFCARDSSSPSRLSRSPVSCPRSSVRLSRTCSSAATSRSSSSICDCRFSDTASACSCLASVSPSLRCNAATSSPREDVLSSSAVRSVVTCCSYAIVARNCRTSSMFRIRMITNASRNIMTITVMTSVNDGQTLSSLTLVWPDGETRRSTNPALWIISVGLGDGTLL